MTTIDLAPVCDNLIDSFSWDDPENVIKDEPLSEDERYKSWEEKRQQNIKNCGYIKSVEDPAGGSVKMRHFYCGEPECKFCGPRMREEMYKSFNTCLDNGEPLRIIKLVGSLEDIKNERAKLVRKYGGKDNCFSTGNDILTEDGFCHEIELVVKTNDDIGEAYTQVDYDDIERWVQKSFYVKKSGNLHKGISSTPPVEKEKKEEDNENNPAEKVYREEWIVSTKNKKELQDIEDQVIENTIHLQPKSFRELRKALFERRQERKRLIEENDIVILDHVVSYVTIRLNDIKWKKPKEAEQLELNV